MFTPINRIKSGFDPEPYLAHKAFLSSESSSKEEGSGSNTPLRVTRTTVVSVSDSFPRQYARTQRFSLGSPRNFSIAEDGADVLFLRSSGSEDTVNALWAINTDTGIERLIVDPREIGAEDPAALPAAEQARRERARESAGGITAYSVDGTGSLAAFSLGGELFISTTSSGSLTVIENSDGAFDPRISQDGQLVSFVVNDGVYIAPTDGSVAAHSIVEGDGETVSWGSAEFVAAEEMRRSRGHWWDPTGTKLAVTRVDVSSVTTWHIAAPNDPARTPQEIRYPAAGGSNADVQLYIINTDDASRKEVTWDHTAHPYLVDVNWEENQPLTLVVQSRDQQSMQVLETDENTGQTKTVLEITDPDWVEIVPGTPRRWRDGWLTIQEHGQNRSLLFNEQPLSSPDQWVRSLVAADETRILYTASVDATVVDLWSHDGEKADCLTDGNGVTQAQSSSSVTVLDQSSIEQPAVTTVSKGETVWTVDDFSATPLVTPQVHFHLTGGLNAHSAVLFPTTETAEQLPIVLDPYGGPHAQRVMRSRNAFLASQWLADQGFCVLVTDGPGTPGRGNGWERKVRGDLAEPVLQTQVDALTEIGEIYGDRVDLSRVGIRGWSFGGYLAALAVLRRPDMFHAAVVGAPVTDWRLYDTHYTERYLGHPEEEPANYERTSLLVDRAEVQRPLMLIHGLADDNVVAAHTLQLSSALLEAGHPHEVLPLSDTTHMTPQEEVAENLLLLQVDFLKRHI